MSKRSNQDLLVSTETKRVKTDLKESHAPNCNDKTCQGCDVGEVEITFKDAEGNPTTIIPAASILVQMALEEASKDQQNDNDDENNGISRRLFDMALEKYQKDESENRVGYAICLIELGKTIAVQESISEGLEILRGEFKKDQQVSLPLARAAIALAISIRKEQDVYFEQQEQELDEEEDTVALDELVQKQQVSKKEIELYKESIQHAKEAFNQLSNNELVEEAQSILHDFRNYGQLLNQPFHKEHANVILDAAIELIQKVPNHDVNDELMLTWAACLLQKDIFVEDKKEKLALYKTIEDLLTKSNKLHVIRNDKENHHVWEMHAMLRINQSNLADDEEEVLDLYTEAIESFKKAHTLNPGNEKVAAMLQMFEGMQAEEEEEEEEEDDDDEEEEKEEDEDEDEDENAE